MYKILCKDGSAKRGRLETVHGTIETPVFMNVATVGAMKGAVSTEDLQHFLSELIKCRSQLEKLYQLELPLPENIL